MNCEFCDSPILPGQSKCANCGAAQTVVHAPPPMATPPEPAEPHAPQPTSDTNKAKSLGMHTASTKSKIAAGLFAILLPGLGIHNFYLGHTGKGLAQLLVSVLSCGYLWIICAIWEFIEGIVILASDNPVDAQGRRLV